LVFWFFDNLEWCIKGDTENCKKKKEKKTTNNKQQTTDNKQQDNK
jgi:hypothetical protein